jgi:hypothetical protein
MTDPTERVHWATQAWRYNDAVPEPEKTRRAEPKPAEWGMVAAVMAIEAIRQKAATRWIETLTKFSQASPVKFR